MAKTIEEIEKLINGADFLVAEDKKFLIQFLSTQNEKAQKAFLKETKDSPGSLKVMANLIRLNYFEGTEAVEKYYDYLISEKSKRLKTGKDKK